jgi:hypothetical protein
MNLKYLLKSRIGRWLKVLHLGKPSFLGDGCWRRLRRTALDGAGGRSRPALRRKLVALSTRISSVTLMQTFDATERQRTGATLPVINLFDRPSKRSRQVIALDKEQRRDGLLP